MAQYELEVHVKAVPFSTLIFLLALEPFSEVIKTHHVCLVLHKDIRNTESHSMLMMHYCLNSCSTYFYIKRSQPWIYCAVLLSVLLTYWPKRIYILLDEAFPPGIVEVIFSEWCSQEPRFVADLFKSGNFMLFTQLQTKYHTATFLVFFR